MTQSEARVYALMQRGADQFAAATWDLLATFDDVNGLSELAVRLGEAGDVEGRRTTIEALRVAMRSHRLGVSGLLLRDPAGNDVLDVGGAARAGSNDMQPVGLSRPWQAEGGKLAEYFTSALVGRPDWRLRLTLDPVALSELVARSLPGELSAEGPAISSLVRLEDGSIAARSQSPQTALASIQRVSQASVAAFRADNAGFRRIVSVLSGQDTLVAFRRIDQLGLAAVVSASASDMLVLAKLRAAPLRRMPYVVLAVSCAISVISLMMLARSRARAAYGQARQAAEAEAAARAELEHLVKCSPALLYRGKLDREGVYSRDFVTPNAKAITGWEPEMLSDPERVWKLSAEEDRHLRGSNYARALRDGRAAVEYRFLRPDGGFSWLRNEALITKRNADGSAEVAGAITNITREREISAFAAMQNRMATLGQIATSLAHELTQPMTVIAMAAAIAQSLAEENNAPYELRTQLSAILNQTDRAGEMIRHLRGYGHADGGGLAAVSLDAAIRGAMTLAETTLREAGVVVSVELPDDLPPIRARLVQVEQVLLNLMMNARDAMRGRPAGERRLRLHATVNGMVRLQVADTGPGVAREVIPRLFEAFYTTKAPGEGTGLGLALCQTMMRSFGGSICVEDAPQGALFVLEFLPFLVQSETVDGRSEQMDGLGPSSPLDMISPEPTSPLEAGHHPGF